MVRSRHENSLGPLFGALMLCIAAALSPSKTPAADRIVLLESFVNDDCLGCITFNALLERLNADYHGRLLHLSYHVWWPDAMDPFYLAAGEEATARRDYYSDHVLTLPAVMINGTPFPEGVALHRADYPFWENLLDSVLNEPADYDIQLQRELNGNMYEVTATITPDAGVPSRTLTAFCAKIEKRVEYESPPGANGERIFYGAVRDMAPDPHGEDISLGTSAATREYSFARDARWDSAEIAFVFFLQDPQTGEIAQAAIDLPRYTLRGETHQQFSASGGEVSYTLELRNLETSSLDFIVDWETSGREDWNIFCSFDGAAVSDSSLITVPPVSQKNITLRVQPGSPGDLDVALSLTARTAIPSAVTRYFTTIYNPDLLLVDDDGLLGYETYYEDALENSTVSHGRWQRAYGPLDGINLTTINALVWWTGLSFPTLDESDRALLADYLDGGGDLLLTGQDIGYDLCDSSYAYFDSLSGSVEFYETYLAARYESDLTSATSLQGTATDPISGNLTISIAGTGGAKNQYFPSIISPISPPAQTAFSYEPEKAGAVYYESGASRVTYFAFGFEAIASAAHRATILGNILGWFGLSSGITPPGEKVLPVDYRVSQNYPNPFYAGSGSPFSQKQAGASGGNGETAISFSTPERVPARVTVYDALGREVATLLDRVVDPGQHRIIFRAGSLPAGIYFCRVLLSDRQQVIKMSLLR